MATATYRAMVARDDVDFELRDIDEQILDILEEGRCTRKHLADSLGVSSEYIYQRVDLMKRLGLVDVIHDGFYEVAETVDADDESERTREREPEPEPEPEPPVNTTSPNASDAVDTVVERVSSGWEDDEERLEQRRAAGHAVLQHAVDSGDAVGKTDAIEKFRDQYHIDGQNEETWWRKNIRPVLKAVGEYSKSRKGYVVEADDLEEFVNSQDE